MLLGDAVVLRSTPAVPFLAMQKLVVGGDAFGRTASSGVLCRQPQPALKRFCNARHDLVLDLKQTAGLPDESFRPQGFTAFNFQQSNVDPDSIADALYPTANQVQHVELRCDRTLIRCRFTIAEHDPEKLTALPAGSFYTEPAGIPHFITTPDGEAVVQVTGTGPTAVHYVDPEHAPKK